MQTEFALKLKALTLAIMVNGLIMGSAAFLFDGQIHGPANRGPVNRGPAPFAHIASRGVTGMHISAFRP
jgi:hypothetical protein